VGWLRLSVLQALPDLIQNLPGRLRRVLRLRDGPSNDHEIRARANRVEVGQDSSLVLSGKDGPGRFLYFKGLAVSISSLESIGEADRR